MLPKSRIVSSFYIAGCFSTLLAICLICLYFYMQASIYRSIQTYFDDALESILAIAQEQSFSETANNGNDAEVWQTKESLYAFSLQIPLKHSVSRKTFFIEIFPVGTQNEILQIAPNKFQIQGNDAVLFDSSITPFILKIALDVTQEMQILSILLKSMIGFYCIFLGIFLILLFVCYKAVYRTIEVMQRDSVAQKKLYCGIAHELKTPLAVIKTKCEVTLLKEREKARYIQVLQENIQSVRAMQDMIKALLMLGRQESEKSAESQNINVYAFLRGIAEDFALLAKSEQKIFTYEIPEIPLWLKTKPPLLRQILQNFLQNALKFTPRNKEVRLKVIAENNLLKIIVKDSGCGLSVDFKELCVPFKCFGNKAGVGLGLFLAKEAAHMLGGEIYLENQINHQGVVAIFTLPIKSIKRE